MKKILFILAISFFFSNASAVETENNAKSETKMEAIESFQTNHTKCCRRTVRNENGDSWTARRCVTHTDPYIAMGRACELAMADANSARNTAHTYTVTHNPQN